MYKAILLSTITFILFVSTLHSQTCQDASVELTAEVQSSPPRITLHWTAAAGNEYVVYRKLKGAVSWGSPKATLPASATEFIDSTIVVATSYEYRVMRGAAGYSGHGYINSGIEVPAIESQGILLVIIDSLFIDSLESEIITLLRDLEGDGWRVVSWNVSRNSTPQAIKAQIVSQYQMDPAETKGVFLLGHVPVPYSGQLNPDAHPDHLGAWPADVYYGEMNGTWTDAIINTVVASDPRNHNVPGDGKFDQSVIPSDVELFVGRVDFANLPSFSQTEIQLMRNYLMKDHRYRHKVIVPDRALLVDDNFGFFGTEAFAANGWKATPLVGTGKVTSGDYFTDLAAKSYLWSYGCGGGWFQGAGGIGSTTDFAASNLNSIFTMLFGSYFGDWDSQDNFLRAPLAQGTILTNVWAGRPHWMFHHMGLGETIGYSTRISQNNNGLYFFSYGARGVHIALMGDPTLRNDVVAPVSNVVAIANGTQVELTWSASTDAVIGYHIYRKTEDDAGYVRVNAEIVTATSFIDPCVIVPGTYEYMIRTLKLEQSPSGSYYNLSQGVFGTINSIVDVHVEADATWDLLGSTVTFINTSQNATSYQWNFGDGQSSTESDPIHVFGDGDYLVTLIATSTCDADTTTFEISISTAVADIASGSGPIIYPNPSNGKFRFTSTEVTELFVYTALGEIVFARHHLHEGEEIDLSEQPEGMYIFTFKSDHKRQLRRVMLHK